ncbi:hypothetical protein [Rhodopseudomonas sp.]|uniref:hypothetical protein n=1 Tax=Rhodopseudomonas sp. TaxID=1078 RepID=UPI0039E4FB7C
MTITSESCIGRFLVDMQIEFDPVDSTAVDGTWRVTCVHAPSGVAMGSFAIAPPEGPDVLDKRSAFERVGGAYRVLSIEVDLDTEELHARSTGLRREVALRQRLWRRRRRISLPTVDAPSIVPGCPPSQQRR